MQNVDYYNINSEEAHRAVSHFCTIIKKGYYYYIVVSPVS